MLGLQSWRTVSRDGVCYCGFDWGEVFRARVDPPGIYRRALMRGFYVVVRLRVEATGAYHIRASAPLVIRINGIIAYQSGRESAATHVEVTVMSGDRMEIAQARPVDVSSEWSFGVRRVKLGGKYSSVNATSFSAYVRAVDDALQHPNGPTLKVYTNAVTPIRCALAIYSMILNGYRPSAVLVYGDYQWSATSRLLLAALLPFAQFVSLSTVCGELEKTDARLVKLAAKSWSTMKVCVSLFCEPGNYCFLDDDVFVLGPMSDALELYQTHDLVYSPDDNNDSLYRSIWCPDRTEPLQAGDVNSGLYFGRADNDRKASVSRLLAASPDGQPGWAWEQGFLAFEFAGRATAALPGQRYFAPRDDGLPGGLLGYDWYRNPCEFATVHFLGPIKPDDRVAAVLLQDVLRGRRHES
jgi:hypothetical protein